MIKLRYYFKLLIAFVARFKGLIVIGILLGVLIFFTTRALLGFFLKGTTEKIGVTGRYHPDELPSFILEKIGDGLTKISENGTPEPNLAKSWETPDKGLSWTFYIDTNRTWQDNTPVTSKSIIYRFSDVEIETKDEKTITFKLKDPFSPFPLVVSKPTFKKGLLGTGEWSLKKITLSGPYVSELTLENKQKDKIIYKFYPTSDRTKLAFKLAQVNKIVDLIDPSPFDTWKTVKVESYQNTNQVVTIFFNTKDRLTGEKSLRQALAYAINKDSLGQRALSPIAPTSWAYNPQVKPYTYDPERAKELLKELPKELKENLEIKLVTTPVLLKTAESISKDWQSVGVKTIIQVSSIIPNEFQTYLTILDIPKDPDQYPLWHTTQTSTNLSKYSDFRIDKLLEDGRSELDLEERKKIYFDFQRFLLEDLPAAFLYYPTYYQISKK